MSISRVARYTCNLCLNDYVVREICTQITMVQTDLEFNNKLLAVPSIVLMSFA